MILFPYLFILTLLLTIHGFKSSFIHSSSDGPIRCESNINLSKPRLKTHLRGVEDRIVGGDFVKDFSKYPFMAFLYMKVKTETGVTGRKCGATLLSPTHALTAAHCLRRCYCDSSTDDSYCLNCTEKRVKDLELFFGNINPVYSVVTRKLNKFYIHPKFKIVDYTHMCRYRFDIAVLELATPLQFNNKISSIKLPEPVTLGKDKLISTMTSSFFNRKKKCFMLGWGKVNLQDSIPINGELLKVAEVPLIGLDWCKYTLPKFTLCDDTTICCNCPLNKSSICHGDSGGPIICGGVQVGVASYSLKSCVGPSMFARVDVNVQWIRDTMSNKHYRTLREN